MTTDTTPIAAWFDSAAARFRPELSRGLDAILQVRATGPETFEAYCAVRDRQLTIARGSHPSPTLTLTGESADLLRLLEGNHEVLNSYFDFFPRSDQKLALAPYDPQMVMWFVLLFRSDPAAAIDYRKLMVGNIEYWEEFGPAWLPIIEARGLRPSHTVLDMGCGTLRVGGHFIRFLDAGKYSGVDIRANTIEEAEQEVVSLQLQDKRPELVHCANIRDLALGRRFDYILATSLLPCVHDPDLRDILFASAKHLADDGIIIGQVNLLEDHPDWKDDTVRWLGFPFVTRSMAFYREEAARVGLVVDRHAPKGEYGDDILVFRHRS